MDTDCSKPALPCRDSCAKFPQTGSSPAGPAVLARRNATKRGVTAAMGRSTTITTGTRPSPVARLAGQVRQQVAKGHLPFMVALYLAAVVLPISFGIGPIRMTGVRLLLIVLIVPMTIRLLTGAYGKVLLVDILFLLHTAWFTLALAITTPDQVITNAGSTGIEFIGGYVLGRAYIRDRESFVALIRALLTICVLLLPFVVIEALTGRALIIDTLSKLPGITSIGHEIVEKRLGLFRVWSVFAHPIHSGLFFTMTFSLCFIGLKGVYGDGRRWLLSVICATCGFLALSSGALLALALQFGLISWAFVFRRTRLRWWILFGLFVLAYIVIDLFSNRTPLHVFLSYATFSAHTAYWRLHIFNFGMDNVWANPIFGIGLHDWIRPSWMHTPSVDNFWLLTAMRYGIPGFLLLAIGWVWALLRIGTRKFDADPALWNLRRAWMFSFVGLSFTLTTVHVWHTLYSFVFFMFGAGIWFLYTQPAQKGEAEPAAPGPEADRPRYSRFAPQTDRRDRGDATGPIPPAQPSTPISPAGRQPPRVSPAPHDKAR